MQFNDLTEPTIKKKSMKSRLLVIAGLVVVTGGLSAVVYDSWMTKNTKSILAANLNTASDRIKVLEKQIADADQRQSKLMKEAEEKGADNQKELDALREQVRAFAIQAKACAVIRKQLHL